MDELTNEEERRIKREGERMIADAKEFSRRINGLMSQVGDLERRMIELERMHSMTEEHYKRTTKEIIG